MPIAWLLGCEPGANPFIEKYFSDCVYSLRDYIGFCLGLAAILFWVVAQIPQWVRNYRTKSAEALSPWFLAQWLLGDTFNLLGCLLQGQQLPTTTYTAMYFVIADVFMMMQYIYYGALQRRKEKILQLQVHRRHHLRRHHHQHGSSRGQNTSNSSYERLVGHDGIASGSRKDPVVHQRQAQQQQQQQGTRNWLQSTAALPILHDSGKQRRLQQEHQLHVREQQDMWTDAIPHQHEGLSSRSSSEHSLAAEDEVLLLQSCAAAAAAHSPSPHGLVIGGVHVGGYRSAIAVGALVALGLVSIAIPARTAWGASPAHGAAVAAASTQRSMQAGQSAYIAENLQRIFALGPGRDATGLTDLGAGRGGRAQSVAGPERDILFVVGTGLGYCSSVLYLCSRLSQIHKNYSRKSSEGLSLAMFMMAVCANMCTGSGIVMRTFTWQEFKEQLPWIIGSLGTIMLDMMILLQSIWYGKKGGAGGAAGSGTASSAAAAGHRHPRQDVTQQLHAQGYQQQQQRQQQQQHQQWRAGALAEPGGHQGAAAYYRAKAATPTAVINIPAAHHPGSSTAAAALLSASAPAAASWSSLSGRQRHQGGDAVAGRRREEE